jgi:5-formyltetrahydrofolate cyclo-ligase
MEILGKKALRKMVLDERGRISEAAAELKNEKISSLLFGSGFYRDAKSVFCFISVEGEPDTRPIILNAFAEGKSVCVPRTGAKRTGSESTEPERIMEAVPVSEEAYRRAWTDWPLSYGIPVPPVSFPSIETIDLVIVPSLALDRFGNRLGHGAGYYDRFIEKCHSRQKRSICAAIQFSEFLMDDPLPHDEYDMKVDLIVTEKGVFIPEASA